MDWLDHDRLGFNYRLSDIACAVGIGQMARLPGMLDCERLPPPTTARRLPRSRVSSFPARTTTALGAGGLCTWCSFLDGVDRDETVRGLATLGIQSKPYLPAIHLMSFYRERFGHREGEFPVCEDVAARSLALPLYPGLFENDAARVAAALRRTLGR